MPAEPAAATCSVDAARRTTGPVGTLRLVAAVAGFVAITVVVTSSFESGGGGLVSTVDDFLAFGRMLLHKGAHGGAFIREGDPAVVTRSFGDMVHLGRIPLQSV